MSDPRQTTHPSTTDSAAIRLGVDLGSMVFRAAFVFPDEDQAVVAIPISVGQYHECFPICEQLKHADARFDPRFFPGIAQRLRRDFYISLAGQERTSYDIVADLLGQTVASAQRFAGQQVGGLVISLAAWQSVQGRSLLREAMRDAGLPPVIFVAHADAAATYFQAELTSEHRHGTALVFSAGYTGLEATIVRFTPKGYRILAEATDPGVLAGNCLDYAILVETFRLLRPRLEAAAQSASQNFGAWGSFQRTIEMAKHELRDSGEVQFRIPAGLLPPAAGDLVFRLHSDPFRKLVDQHMDRALGIVEELMEDAGIEPEEIGHVLLAGGSTHLPTVASRVGSRFAKAEVHHLPPDAIAAGAARIATEADLTDRLRPPPPGADIPFAPIAQENFGLVTLLGAPPAPTRPADPPVSPAETPIQQISLDALRRLGQADPARALRRLAELQRAVGAEIARLEAARTGR